MHLAAISVPFLCGFMRPVVVLPDRMCATAYCPQLPGILAHELAHVRSCDTLWNMLMQAVSIALWFHPLAWRIGSAHRSACDAVCDAVSASFIGDVQDYCRTLARVALYAAHPAASAGLAMARGADVRRRLAMLQRRVFALPLRRRVVVPAGIIAISVLTLVAGLKFALAETPPKANDQQAAAPAEKNGQGVEKPADGKAKEDQKTASDASVRPGYRAMKIQMSDSAGKPLAEARIKVDGQADKSFGVFKYTTDSEGRATIDAPRTGAERYCIWAEKSGYVTALAEWDSRKNDVPIPDTFTFALEPGVEIGGWVRDEQGKPIAGMKISVGSETSLANEIRRQIVAQDVSSDAEGKWRIDCAPKDPSGFDMNVTLKHPEFGCKRFGGRELQVAELYAQTATFTMRKGVYVEGLVTYPDGKPATGATVGLYAFYSGTDCPKTKTDENGRYRLAASEPGIYTLAATADGFVPGWKEFSVDKDGKTVDLKLGKGEPIRLRVVDQQGKPVPGAIIGLILGNGNLEKWPPVMLDYETATQNARAYRTPTDAGGRWNMVWVPDNQITLYIEKKGYVKTQASFAPDEREQVITLEAGEWSVAGRHGRPGDRSPDKRIPGDRRPGNVERYRLVRKTAREQRKRRISCRVE